MEKTDFNKFRSVLIKLKKRMEDIFYEALQEITEEEKNEFKNRVLQTTFSVKPDKD